MNRGNIPGFYYDEVKQKYFKIQANHLVPQGAKYSKGQVKRENRQTKKRKREERRTIRRAKEAVTRNAILQHPLVGRIGLGRELDLHGSYHHLDRRDAAVASQYELDVARLSCGKACESFAMRDAQYLSDTKQMVMLFRESFSHWSPYYSHEISVLNHGPWDWDKAVAKEAPIDVGSNWLSNFAHDTLGSSNDVATISTAIFNDVTKVVACADSRQGHTVYFGSVPLPNDADNVVRDNPENNTGVYLQSLPSGQFAQTFASPINPITGMTVVFGEAFGEGRWTLWDLNVNCMRTQTFNSENELLECADWLDPNTIAFGCNQDVEHGSRYVGLWDTRTVGGIVSRFNIKNRMTDIANPYSLNQSLGQGHELLVSTNHSINIYDTRMPSKAPRIDPPLLSISHVHEGPRAQLAVNSLGNVAAVDRANVVQLYSLRKGIKLRSLPRPAEKVHLPSGHSARGAVKRLRWYENPDTGVEMLMASRANQILRWRP